MAKNMLKHISQETHPFFNIVNIKQPFLKKLHGILAQPFSIAYSITSTVSALPYVVLHQCGMQYLFETYTVLLTTYCHCVVHNCYVIF